MSAGQFVTDGAALAFTVSAEAARRRIVIKINGSIGHRRNSDRQNIGGTVIAGETGERAVISRSRRGGPSASDFACR